MEVKRRFIAGLLKQYWPGARRYDVQGEARQSWKLKRCAILPIAKGEAINPVKARDLQERRRLCHASIMPNFLFGAI
jgi:hypothetical protein